MLFNLNEPLYPQFMPKDEFIVRSFMDTDDYKVLMARLIQFEFAGTSVDWKLIVRSKDANLPKYILKERLEKELNHVMTLRLTDEHRALLAKRHLSDGRRVCPDDFLDFLQYDLKLPPYKLSYVGKDVELSFGGAWEHNTWWEIFGLEIVNELYRRGQVEQMEPEERERFFQDAVARLERKIDLLLEHTEVVVVDFGSRRRLAGPFHLFVDWRMSSKLSSAQFRGTSNVHNAFLLGIEPSGTNAHELTMAISGILIALYGKGSKPLHAAQRRVLDSWYNMYGHDLAIGLPDTWTKELFFQVYTAEDAKKGRGLRQDSGEPIAEGERYIKEWEKREVDPKTKLIVFSDGLEVEDAIRIAAHFKGRVIMIFGIGTSLTNDTWLKAISIVIKVVEAMGIKVTKLPENPEKALGSPEDIQWTMREVGYNPAEHVAVECRS